MKKIPLLQKENRVFRTYRGGKQLEAFLGNFQPSDSFQPEDWLFSFVEAKNKNYIPCEGISQILWGGKTVPINELIKAEDFGPGRNDSGVLVKLLDAGERLGIQTHPTPQFSKKYFGTNYGKTECWHILTTDEKKDSAVYIGFKKGITREYFAELFYKQEIENMLASLWRFPVKAGDTVLVKAGTPHAIGAGCFILEIQEPCDYTMRVETTTVAGEKLTRQQISYGLSDEALLDCFNYEGLSEEEAYDRFFIKPRFEANSEIKLVTYEDTPCFALSKLTSGAKVRTDCFSIAVVLTEGALLAGEERFNLHKGDTLFIPYDCGNVVVEKGEMILCYPPQI